MSDPIVLAAVGAAVAIGATTQRIAGIGIALVAAPGLTLAFGPVTAIPLTNLIALLLNLTILTTTARHIDWRRGLPIAAASAIVIVPIAYQLRGIDPRLLQAGVGMVVLVAVGATFWLRTSREPATDTALGRVLAGATAGAFGVAAGLSGPPLAVYAARTAWRGPSFVPTLQGISVVINVIAVLAAPRIGLTVATWAVVIVAIGAGAFLGAALAPRITARRVEAVALLLGGAGAVAAVATALG